MVRARDPELSGWHHDRHPEPERIDVRVTVYALRALRDSRTLLSRIANSRALRGLDVRFVPAEPRTTLDEFVPLDIEQLVDKPEKSLSARILDILCYLRFHEEPTGACSAPKELGAFGTMLLHGPPGGGKTSALELLAHELDWPVVTIGMSEFLANGY